MRFINRVCGCEAHALHGREISDVFVLGPAMPSCPVPEGRPGDLVAIFRAHAEPHRISALAFAAALARPLPYRCGPNGTPPPAPPAPVRPEPRPRLSMHYQVPTVSLQWVVACVDEGQILSMDSTGAPVKCPIDPAWDPLADSPGPSAPPPAGPAPLPVPFPTPFGPVASPLPSPHPPSPASSDASWAPLTASFPNDLFWTPLGWGATEN